MKKSLLLLLFLFAAAPFARGQCFSDYECGGSPSYSCENGQCVSGNMACCTYSGQGTCVWCPGVSPDNDNSENSGCALTAGTENFKRLDALFAKGTLPTDSDFQANAVWSGNGAATSHSLFNGDRVFLATLEIRKNGKKSLFADPITGCGPLTTDLLQKKAWADTSRLTPLQADATQSALYSDFLNPDNYRIRFLFRKASPEGEKPSLILKSICNMPRGCLMYPYGATLNLIKYTNFTATPAMLFVGDLVQTTQGVDLYAGSKVVGHLEGGETGTIRAIQGSWISLKKSDESVLPGWIQSKFLKLHSNP